MNLDQIKRAVEQNVEFALNEDVGDGDVNSALIAIESQSNATLTARAPAVFCGKPWVDEVARKIGGFSINWNVEDGDSILADQNLATMQGLSRSILTAERVMLNFLQILSGTATTTRTYYELVRDTHAIILDTRKTLPGLRIAQKYAVSVGGGRNHRIGLFDAYLIKENHIQAAGSIHDAVHAARANHPELPLEVEVETLQQLAECVALRVPRALLDNFSLAETGEAVSCYGDQIELEVSGGVTLENVRQLAETGVHYISVGALTKDVVALDLSLRFTETNVQ